MNRLNKMQSSTNMTRREWCSVTRAQRLSPESAHSPQKPLCNCHIGFQWLPFKLIAKPFVWYIFLCLIFQKCLQIQQQWSKNDHYPNASPKTGEICHRSKSFAVWNRSQYFCQLSWTYKQSVWCISWCNKLSSHFVFGKFTFIRQPLCSVQEPLKFFGDSLEWIELLQVILGRTWSKRLWGYCALLEIDMNTRRTK